ncbi:MAG: ESPR domain-containing protein [Alcaligenaceae bacterium]|nr:ESPR domain-containing protein [Alcaligenaceae bacterium]
MNKIFRVLWNNSLGLWQCVSELVSAQGKKNKLVVDGALVEAPRNHQ